MLPSMRADFICASPSAAGLSRIYLVYRAAFRFKLRSPGRGWLWKVCSYGCTHVARGVSDFPGVILPGGLQCAYYRLWAKRK